MSKKALAASVLTLSMLLSACGANSPKIEDVHVDLKGGKEAPAVSFSKPFSTDHDVTHVIDEGNGESIQDDDAILLNASIFNGENGNLEESTYSTNPLTIQMSKLKQGSPEIYEVIKNLKVGGSFVYSTNQTRSSGSTNPSTASSGTPTNVEVYTITSKLPKEQDIPKYAQGTEQSPAPELPAFSLDQATGEAELSFAEDRGEAPKDLISRELITGTGPELQETDMVFVRYIGAQWSDGTVFDGNYNSQITPFKLNGVIKGWTQGLKGKKVGSRVELVIPANLAYGDEGKNGSPKGTLVFLVDILAAAPTVSPSPLTPNSSQSTIAVSSASPTAIPSSLAPTADPTKQ